MSETRYRANLMAGSVDKIEIVNESTQYVDVSYPGGKTQFTVWSATVRREAKVTAYSKVCKTEKEAWQAIEVYALEQVVLAEQAIRRWQNTLTVVEEHLAEPADRAGD